MNKFLERSVITPFDLYLESYDKDTLYLSDVDYEFWYKKLKGNMDLTKKNGKICILKKKSDS